MSEIKPHVVEMYGKRILLLNNFIEDCILPNPLIADVWLVNHQERSKVRKFLRSVVRSHDMRVYLKPIYLEDNLRPFFMDDERVMQRLSDGFFGNTDPLQIATLTDQVAYFIEKHRHGRKEKASQQEQILQYIFDYNYTRRSKIVPMRLHQSLTGYAYPRIDSFFFNRSDAYLNSRNILKEAEEQGYLKRTYFDTQHLCKSCSSGFLNYHEVCPKCHEHDLKASNLIHHFRCAYVGPETDFVAHDKLVCPKCSVQLKNVGVDYDKPGKMFTCNNQRCNHQFQEAPIQVGCVDCGTEQETYELVVKKVYQYELSEKGIQRFLFREEQVSLQHG
ncbi:hypothetical protein FAZ15_13925 [Sphingobacterium olei]|uniref:Thaumarchaeal output domain-containing protein n=1 Tax=Sphingobacterium olei TaxID=2571155 RepID=A0A4U0NYN3_9SPHI|nr:hypothetical protein [Sphingobacterium olei]TJZ59981.1 hypothetical protein FAZ15_13925 [Sphingobacterium olei]